MRKAILLLLTLLLAGCAHEKLMTITASNFRAPRLERELNFYVARHPEHATNHFYIGATKLDHGQLVEAMVYWKEERTLVPYVELEADAQHDIFAWPGHELKLDRDTVDTADDIAGSTYLVTHQQWAGWAEQCITKGKLYSVTAADARRAFPAESTAQK